MEIETKILKYCLTGVVALGLVLGAGFVLKQRAYEKRILELQNEAAAKDKTIEVQKNLYTKLSLQSNDVKGTLDQKDAQVKELEDQIKKQKQQLLDATSVSVQWKKAYEGLASNATETTVPPGEKPGDKQREKVDFHQDFGYIGVDGWTLTNPAQAWVRVKQNRPLKITLAMSQDSNKAWHTYASSSEDNVGIDIQVTAVNPNVLQPKWYENIGLLTSVGGGTNQMGGAFLVGEAITYKFRQFTLGPSIWLGINNRVDKYYGLVFEWRPFQKTP